MADTYKLVGFATAGGEAPHFATPVFFRDGNLFVQVPSADGNRIASFADFDDDVDILEHASGDTASVGGKIFHAILDAGDRVVCGERDYVERYLLQNLRNYIDKPFFSLRRHVSYRRFQWSLTSPRAMRMYLKLRCLQIRCVDFAA